MIQLSKDPMGNLLQAHADRAATNDNHQWIWKFPGEWSENHFQQVLRYFREDRNFQESISQEQLQVFSPETNTILVIQGVPAISLYCYNESPIMIESRSWIHRTQHISELLPSEMPIDVISDIIEEKEITEPTLDAWETMNKHYRLYREFRYTHDKVIHVVRMVREVKDATSMAKSNVTTTSVKYEFEMICRTKQVMDAVVHGVHFMQVITEQQYILNKVQQEQILDEYQKLVESVIDKKKRYASTGRIFLAPKPVTLEQSHLAEPGPESYGLVSIWKGYAVTEKADGERMLLYINQEGHAYLINNSFEVFDTGLIASSSKLYHSLIDGEFVKVSQRRDASSKDLFAAFDLYFLEGKSVMKENLIERIAKLRICCESSSWKTSADIDLFCKEHIIADGISMKDTCRVLLSGGPLGPERSGTRSPYETDGLIFTPVDLAVYGFYPGITPDISENVRWSRVFKWKPAEQNTIDFLVQYYQDVKHAKEFKLFTGYNAVQWEPISVMEGLRMRYDNTYYQQKLDLNQTYRAKLFQPVTYTYPGIEIAKIPLSHGEPRCLDGSIVTDKSIVEFAYDVPKREWIPLRVRTDKTRIYQKTGQLSKTANDLKVAYNIWRSIHQPVTASMLTGEVSLESLVIADTLEERLLGTEDVYYARDIPREKMLSVHMLNFHNHGIKKMLYEKTPNQQALLELACGQAGDLPRWRDGKFRFVLGIDLAKDNICNPTQGSYARMLKQKRYVTEMTAEGMEQRVYMDAIFAVGDCSKRLETGEAAKDLDSESYDLLRILYEGQGANQRYLKQYMVRRAAKKFSMVSCQFAIHYFFESEQKLKGFFHNVAYNLMPGGVFIATFMDGERVRALLENAPNGVAEGRKTDAQIPVWAILRRYIENDSPYQKRVDVFLENTNQLIPEYLVSLKLLTEIAAQFQLELVETELFSETFQRLMTNITDQKPVFQSDLKKLQNDPVQLQFSFLNRWVVFKKNLQK